MSEEKEKRIEEIVNLIGMIKAFQEDLGSVNGDLIYNVGVDGLNDHMEDVVFDLQEELDLLEAKDDDDFIDPAGGSGLHSHV